LNPSFRSADSAASEYAAGIVQWDPAGLTRLAKGAQKGVCGATADTIAARNFIRMVAGGAAAHSDHGRGVAENTSRRGKTANLRITKIKDEQKLIAVALDLGIKS